MKAVKNFNLLVGVLLLCVTTKSQSQNLEVTQYLYPDYVEFWLENTGVDSVIAEYVIVEDEILMLTDGSCTIAPSDVFIISENIDSANFHAYEIEVEIVEQRTAKYKDVHEVGMPAYLIYPNPVIESFLIEFSESLEFFYSVRVFTLSGKQIAHVQTCSSLLPVQINLSQYPSGLYYVCLKSNVINDVFLLNKR